MTDDSFRAIRWTLATASHEGTQAAGKLTTPIGREVAIVSVSTSPNPASGYMEIVPLDQLTSLDWSLDEAMRFIMRAAPMRRRRWSLGRCLIPKQSSPADA